MGRTKTKFGKNMAFYLSNESIAKLTQIMDKKGTKNRSNFIEHLIIQEWEKDNAKNQE